MSPFNSPTRWRCNADGCARGGAANSVAIGKPLDKADAALRRQPEGKASQAAHCVVALRLCSQATRRSGRLALHGLDGFRVGELKGDTPWGQPLKTLPGPRCWLCHAAKNKPAGAGLLLVKRAYWVGLFELEISVRVEPVETLRSASTGLYGLAPINQPVRKGEEPGCRDIDRHRQLLQTQPTDTLSHHPIPAPSVDKEPGDGTA